jgi:hypothetical protein
MFQTSLVHFLYYSHLLPISSVTNVADICHRRVVILVLGELDHLALSSLIKLIHVQSIHALAMLISSYSNSFYHQHQISLV